MAQFPNLETLYVVDHVPQVDGNGVEFSWSSLINLAVASATPMRTFLSDWIQHISMMPNLHNLTLQGFVDLPAGRSSLEVELPVLQYLHIDLWFQSANYTTFIAPQLERMTLFVARGYSPLLSAHITPQHLVNMVRLIYLSVGNRMAFLGLSVLSLAEY